ncbi:hypothetical protein JVU11DRAFT_5779 [Chiua virens]|nr:hypothetical protein JVU11DRAFT_5779 [Chiua virens]
MMLSFALYSPAILSMQLASTFGLASALRRSSKSLECRTLDQAAIIYLPVYPLNQLSLELPDDLQTKNVRPTLTPPAHAFLESLRVQANALPLDITLGSYAFEAARGIIQSG